MCARERKREREGKNGKEGWMCFLISHTLIHSVKGRIKGIPKLEDAQFAGTSRSNEATLIVTEGDSAKALAISGKWEKKFELFD